jgi:hypothetical protein
MLSNRMHRAGGVMSHATPSGYRSVSKMLGVYLDDIDQLVRAEEGDKALRLAALLPHVIAALEDPVLRGSCAAADAWVDRWLSPAGGEESLVALRPHWHRACVPGAVNSPTMEAGIKQLRLRRHPRESLAGAHGDIGYELAPAAGSDLRLARDVAVAAREWYAEFGLDAPRVQENLARLAILR